MLVIALPKLPAEIYAERARRVLSDGQFMVLPDMAQTAENYALLGLQYDLKNPELYYCLGEAGLAEAMMATDPAERTKKYSECVEAYRKSVELAPGDTRLILCLATTLDALERFGESAPLYARVLKVDPHSIYAYWAYGMHLELQQKLDEAEAAYRRSYELGAGPLMGGGAAGVALERIAELRKKQPPAPDPNPANATQPPAPQPAVPPPSEPPDLNGRAPL
jgi:tetratricopeptide (TPR) repeat protein